MSHICIHKFVAKLYFLSMRYSLQEKISDMETENKILRQQTLLTASKGVAGHPSGFGNKVG